MNWGPPRGRDGPGYRRILPDVCGTFNMPNICDKRSGAYKLYCLNLLLYYSQIIQNLYINCSLYIILMFKLYYCEVHVNPFSNFCMKVEHTIHLHKISHIEYYRMLLGLLESRIGYNDLVVTSFHNFSRTIK